MLSPGNRVILLPCDREIMELRSYRSWHVRTQCRFESKIRPGEALDPVTLGLVLIGVGAALFAAGTLLTPSPRPNNPWNANDWPAIYAASS